jgi:hypothetical protein
MSVVERGIGQLKRRWGILHGELRVNPEKACKYVKQSSAQNFAISEHLQA